MEYKVIKFEKKERIAYITLNNPAAYNPYGRELALELYDVMKKIKWDNEIRVVVIKAVGKAYSAGGDIKQFKQAVDNKKFTELVEDLILYLNATVLLMKKMDKIIISFVNGICAGVGLSLALNTDISIATETSQFIGAYNGLATTPDGGSSYVVLKNAGLPRTLWFFLSNEAISAKEANQWGILSKVVENGTGEAYVDRLAEKIAKGPFKANILTKRLFVYGEKASFEEYIEMEKDGIIKSTRTNDMKEAVNSFIEKREPEFE
jgi:2-(1,2-epoxy-1,2-dihydrophenyl)acetyl-CoA isomerase